MSYVFLFQNTKNACLYSVWKWRLWWERWVILLSNMYDTISGRGRFGHDHMVVGFTTFYAISVYHHKSCEFEPRSWHGVLVTTLCDKVCQWLAVIFSGYSGFLHQWNWPPRYNWNIVESGVYSREIWLFRGWTNFHISLMQGKWMFYSTRPTFWWILPNEIFWPSLFTKLLFWNISGVIFINMEYRYMTKVLKISNKGNTILLRGKYDVVEREIRCCWEGNTMDCFDQSNFYISRINIIEWNNMW
jgi:hypothetical protein